MRKFMAVLVLGLFLLSGCAAVPKHPITPSDLPDLKGKWEGMRELSLARVRTSSFTELEIYNDTPPLKGKVTLHLFSGTDRREYPFGTGEIDKEGRLVIRMAEDVVMGLSLYKEDGKLKLFGSYYYQGKEGTLTLYKK